MEFLIYVSVFLGVLLGSVLLIFKASRQSANKYLSITLFCLAYVTLLSFFNESGKILEYPHLIRTGHLAAYLIFPFLYLFFKGAITGEKKWKLIYWLFFLPTLVYLVDFYPFFIFSLEEKIALFSGKIGDSEALFHVNEGLFKIQKLHFVFRTIWGLGFLVAIGRVLVDYWGDIVKAPFKERSFFRFLVLIWVVFVLILLVPAGLNLAVTLQLYTISFLSGCLSTVLLMMSLSLVFYPSLLYGYIWDYKDELNRIKQDEAKIEPNLDSSDLIEVKQNLEDELHLFSEIEEFVKVSQVFRQVGYTIHKLAMEKGIPAYKISTIINAVTKNNFNSWLNEFRVEYFISLMENGEGEKYTLDSLAVKSGFSSRTTLTSSFKKQMGMPPGQFMKQIKVKKT
ncbi:MAG: AraC family transcriptional regulator [Cytophagales bacterium]|nr:MAG: AraC family transcriptional regulator [Cytophagales bacterium]